MSDFTCPSEFDVFTLDKEALINIANVKQTTLACRATIAT